MSTQAKAEDGSVKRKGQHAVLKLEEVLTEN